MNRDLDPRMVADVVAAYLSRNEVATENLEDVIAEIGRGLRRAVDGAGGEAAGVPETGDVVAGPGAGTFSNWRGDRAPDDPYVSIGQSIQPDYLICLEDGKKKKMMMRHLRAAHNMTPDEYRTKWGLERDYPMTAPNYSELRRQLARGGPLPNMNGEASSDGRMTTSGGADSGSGG